MSLLEKVKDWALGTKPPKYGFAYWLCPWDGTPMESPGMNSDTHRCTKCNYWIDAWYPPAYGWKVLVEHDRYGPRSDELCVNGVWYVVWRENLLDADGSWIGSKTRVWKSP